MGEDGAVPLIDVDDLTDRVSGGDRPADHRGQLSQLEGLASGVGFEHERAAVQRGDSAGGRSAVERLRLEGGRVGGEDSG